MNEKEMVEFWRRNEKPFGLCPKAAQEWLRQFDGHCLLYVLSGEWVSFDSKTFTSVCVYRLPPDYQPKPKGLWVECEVVAKIAGPDAGFYMFCHGEKGSYQDYRLSEAPGMVGFGGVEYEHYGMMPNFTVLMHDGKLCRPIRVKFWVEE